jgi:hypothetical protein
MTEDRCAILGHTSLIDGDTVPWASEAAWLRSLLSQAFSPFKNPTTFLSDNQSAFAPMCDHPYHARTMHIDVHHHWIKWVAEQGTIDPIYCPPTTQRSTPPPRRCCPPRPNTLPQVSDCVLTAQ